MKTILPLAIGIVYVFFVTGCADETIVVANALPQASVVESCYEGDVPQLRIRLSDGESDPVDLSFRVGVGSDAPWVFPGPTGSGLVGLTTSPEGRTHHIEWGPCPEASTDCVLPPAVTALDPEFGTSCACAVPPQEDPFPTPPLILTARDREGGTTTLSIDADQFDESPCGP